MISPTSFDLPPFPGFREEGIQFLRDLRDNNERDWFKPRKSTYEDELVWPMKCLIAQLAAEASRHDIPLTADPEHAVFRIYRDIRFSRDKRPYKTHVGAVLTRSGDRKAPGGLYIHVEPGQSYVTGGFWRPETRFLQGWRRQIEALPERFLDLMESVRDAGLILESDEKLKRLPRGSDLDAEHPAAEYLRWKSFLATRYVEDNDLLSPSFASAAVDTMRGVLPLLDFGWRISDGRAAAEDHQ